MSEQIAAQVKLDGCSVFWESSGHLFRSDKAGGAAQALEHADASFGDYALWPLGTGSPTIYAAYNEKLVVLHPPQLDRTELVLTRAGAPITPMSVAAFGEYLYVGTLDSGATDAGGAILRYPLEDVRSGVQPLEAFVVSNSGRHPHDLLADEAGILYVLADTSVVRIDGADSNAPIERVLASDLRFGIDGALSRAGDTLATAGEESLLTISRVSGETRSYPLGGAVSGVTLVEDAAFTTRLGERGLVLTRVSLATGTFEASASYGTLTPASLAADVDGLFVGTSAGLFRHVRAR